MEESNLFLSTHRPLVITLGGLVLFILIVVPIIKEYFSPIMRKERKIDREKKEQERLKLLEEIKHRRKVEQEKTLEQKESLKEEKLDTYQKLRKAIESMPQYELWRQAVFKEFGRKCAMCGSTENLEVDHRYKSFYAIIKECRITNTTQAYECAALWNVNNGAPLCKTHHDKTTSSVYRNLKQKLI
ncbi:MAG: hypothetical protein WCT07_04675 [Candidatus Paceibacterota bacterium]